MNRRRRMSVAEVACERRCSAATVRTHVKHIFQKTHTNRQGEPVQRLRFVAGSAWSCRIPIISEIELTFEASAAPIIAITGTDGKSTMTVLVEHILRSAGRECIAGGNLGVPLCELVEDISPDGYLVAEVSAFQLWTTHQFAPAALGGTYLFAHQLALNLKAFGSRYPG